MNAVTAETIAALGVFRNVIIEGPPGTGKSHSVAAIADAWPRALGVDAAGSIANGSGPWAITFHPSTGYEEFVEGIRYDAEIDPISGKSKGFVLRGGVFRGWVEAARASPENDFLVLVDEINRANVSRVLGDLLLGLETSKRMRHDPACARSDGIHVDCWNGGVTTQLAYSNEVIGVPDNLYILATMNSSDRSIAPLDSALRRRFAFVRVNPLAGVELQSRLSEALPSVGDEVIARSVEALDCLNDALMGALGPDSLLGHSYLFEISSRISGGRSFWMELDSVAVQTGSQLQVTKDWASRLLLATTPGKQVQSKGMSVELDVDYRGSTYENVILENPVSGNIRFSANGSGIPFSAMSDGIGVWSPLGAGKLALEYHSAPAGGRASQVSEYAAKSVWSGSSSTRKFGVIPTPTVSRGDDGEALVWRYSILPQLIDTVMQAYVPELLVPGLREAWVRDNLPGDLQAKVVDRLVAFEQFLNEHLGLEIVKGGHGLTSGLSIKELQFEEPIAIDAQDGAESDPSAESTSE